jgi:hypothetical protein
MAPRLPFLGYPRITKAFYIQGSIPYDVRGTRMQPPRRGTAGEDWALPGLAAAAGAGQQ